MNLFIIVFVLNNLTRIHLGVENNEEKKNQVVALLKKPSDSLLNRNPGIVLPSKLENWVHSFAFQVWDHFIVLS
jgi:hypothetical protein